ncbi:MAG: hypothetical protein LUC45_09305 [Paraprevotella sp.]|nr:hypothetical protein [Paraprevotella sp.]
MKNKNVILRPSGCILAGILLSVLLSVTACHSKPAVPDTFQKTEKKPLIFPDYTDITCPWNIAPLNFKVMNAGKRCVAEIQGRGTSYVVESDGEGNICFDSGEWRKILETHKGQSLTVTLYIDGKQGWRRLHPYTLQVAPEPIDSFLTYRLIEPGYVAFRRMGIYQRNLTDFDVKTLYENNAQYDDKQNHCVNCHNYQNYGTKRMMLHVRANYAGTMVADGGRLEKVGFPKDSLPGGAVYPAWHPTRPWIMFSSNRTGQSFHINHPEKVEVEDMASDLIFYDHEKKTVRYILHTDSVLETFPHWHPGGRRLFYTAAYVPDMAALSPEDKEAYAIEHYKDLRYDIMYMDFDPDTQTFGPPHKLVDCSARGKSASEVRVSPDGRYLLYTLADYGQFHIWHQSVDLWAFDLQGDKGAFPLQEANSPEADSYHSWSSNGRWIAFSSRRDDGNYTRVYITYFDRNGRARKAFMLPQADPGDNILLLKSYNVPELTREPVGFSREILEKAVRETQAETVRFESQRPQKAESSAHHSHPS